MTRIRFSRAAQADLDAIDDYTIQRFGLLQAKKTAAVFKQACDELVEFPGTGMQRPDLSPPNRPLRFRTVLTSFVIAYEARDDGIFIARILHGARHLAEELGRDAGDE